jgi:hypothetical protein
MAFSSRNVPRGPTFGQTIPRPPRYATASITDAERVVFNMVKVWFPGRAVWIKFIGTHKSYDAIDVTKL